MGRSASRLDVLSYWDAFLLTVVVKSAYINYYTLPVSLNQSDHSSLITFIFNLQILLTERFFVLNTIFCEF